MLNELVEEIELLSGKKVLDLDGEIFGESGLMDSMNIFHIMLFIQMNFSVEINPEEISLESFGTVNKIITYTNNKLLENTK